MLKEVFDANFKRKLFCYYVYLFLCFIIVINNFSSVYCTVTNIMLNRKLLSEENEEQLFDLLESSQNLLKHKNYLKNNNGNDKNFLGNNNFGHSRFMEEEGQSLDKKKYLSNMVLYLTNFKNSQYVGTINIGNPNQEIEVIFDTGSSNFWITSSRCQDTGCLLHKSYDATISSTYQKVGTRVEVEFGSGLIEGVFCKDTIQIGSLSIPFQEFGEIEKEQGDIFTKLKFSGILGLSFPNLSTLKYTPLFDSIIKRGLLKKNWFSFYLTDGDEEAKSQIIFGEPKHDFYIGSLNWHQVSEESYWQVNMDDIYIDNTPINICPNGPCKLVIDTGTSIMTGPSNDLETLLNKIPLDNCENVSHLPELGFKIGDLLYTIKPEEYVIFSQRIRSSFLEISKNESSTIKNMNLNSITKSGNANKAENSLNSKTETKTKVKIKESLMLNMLSEKDRMHIKKGKQSMCKRAFMPLDVDKPRGPLWVLGDIFLRKYFVVFDRDQKRIGIAERRKNVMQ